MRKTIAAGLLAGTALLASGGVAHADADSDFVAVVNGIEADGTFSWLKIRSDSDWIKIGKGVCGNLDDGDTLWGVTTYLTNNHKVGFKIDEAGKFVAAAVDSYCPSHATGH